MRISRQVLLICITTLLGSSMLLAQNMYEVGATWYFHDQAQVPFQAHGYIKYSIGRDTLLKGESAYIVTKKLFYYNGNQLNYSNEYIYEDSNRVYFWNDSTFELMYDFNLRAGDTLDVTIENYHCDSVTPIIVDSIGIINIDGQNLRIQYSKATYYYMNEYGGGAAEKKFTLIEKIGNTQTFIFNPYCAIDESFTYGGLRCYTDSQIIYKSTWWK